MRYLKYVKDENGRECNCLEVVTYIDKINQECYKCGLSFNYEHKDIWQMMRPDFSEVTTEVRSFITCPYCYMSVELPRKTLNWIVSNADREFLGIL